MEKRNHNQVVQANPQQDKAQQLLMKQKIMQGQQVETIPQQAAEQGVLPLQNQIQAPPVPVQQYQQRLAYPELEMTQNLEEEVLDSMQQPYQKLQHDYVEIRELADRLYSQALADEKIALRGALNARLEPQIIQSHKAQGSDIVAEYFYHKATLKVQKQADHRGPAKAPELALAQQSEINQHGGTLSQPQRSENLIPLNGSMQTQSSAELTRELSLIPQEKRRVKFYEWRNNKWFDKGQGFCNVLFLFVCASFLGFHSF
jgi:hypothetical protein